MGVCIIAEAGVNHNGRLELAKKMAEAAKRAGADYVKFQTAIPELVVSRHAQKAVYQQKSTGSSESQLDMIRRLHFDFSAHRELKRWCDQIGIAYLSSAFDLPSVAFLSELQLELYKIPSGEITNLPYLEAVSSIGAPVLLSTGMSEEAEIAKAVEVLKNGGAGPITLLHCNTEYPTPYEDANLLSMVGLSKTFRLPVGLSDHTLGWECAVAAVALGAVVIEKHFTLDKTMPGPDQAASLDAEELQQMVRAVRHTEIALGSAEKRVSVSEAPNRLVARKSIVAAVPVKKGTVFTRENITVKRPGTGLSPMFWYQVLGKTAKRDYAQDEPVDAETADQGERG